jgi:antibiotic biosynthesis monooxygenase (ABM) superfamily enzyme
MKPIPKWKMAIMIWLGIYPVITAIIFIVFPFMNEHNWPLPLRTFAITLTAVPVMVYAVLPVLQKILKNWLHK